MKTMKTVLMLLFVVILAMPCHAALKTLGKGDKLTFDPAGIPATLKPNWEIVKVKCIKCHTMERTVVSITTGIAPITGQPFDKRAAEAYGKKMMRKADSNMTKADAKASVDLMIWMLDEAAK